MALRLSSPQASYGSSPTNTYVQRLVNDVTISTTQKTDCLKTLSVVVKNLLDPAKSQDAKYRTLKLDNAKLQQKLYSIGYVKDLLKVIGFVQQTGPEGGPVLTLPLDALRVDRLQTFSNELAQASQTVAMSNPTTSSSSSSSLQPTNKKPRVLDDSNLTSKQKARILLDEKERLDKLRAKEHRQKNIDMLKQDKLARATDPNWKPKVSAACAKTGSGLQSFRDRHGEGD